MIRSKMRSIGSVALGLIVALILVTGVEGVSAVLHPFPEGFGGTSEEVMEHVANYPAWVLALLGGAGWGAAMPPSQPPPPAAMTWVGEGWPRVGWGGAGGSTGAPR